MILKIYDNSQNYGAVTVNYIDSKYIIGWYKRLGYGSVEYVVYTAFGKVFCLSGWLDKEDLAPKYVEMEDALKGILELEP